MRDLRGIRRGQHRGKRLPERGRIRAVGVSARSAEALRCVRAEFLRTETRVAEQLLYPSLPERHAAARPPETDGMQRVCGRDGRVEYGRSGAADRRAWRHSDGEGRAGTVRRCGSAPFSAGPREQQGGRRGFSGSGKPPSTRGWQQREERRGTETGV